jgi:uncharacterized protein YqjF (DUF2071 family)
MTESDIGAVGARLPADLVAQIGQLGYYRSRHDDFIDRCPGLLPPPYYLEYGQKYCERFHLLRGRLSPVGQGWIQRTLQILQRRIEDRRALDPGAFSLLEHDGAGFRRFAYGTHPEAYIEGGLALLPPEDVLLVMQTPDARDLLNHDGIEQIVRTALNVVLTNGPVHNIAFVLEAAEELQEHLLEKSGKTWRAAIDAADGQIETAREELQEGLGDLVRTAEHNFASLLSGITGIGMARVGVDWLIMRQDWTNPVFCSWRLPAEVVRPLVPPQLQLDLHEGAAWVSMVPLQMTNVGIVKPTLPPLPPFAEINLRTYVRYRGRSGVYFFSLDCGEVMLDIGARLFFRLPYKLAKVGIAREGEWFRCENRSLTPGREASLRCRYRPTGVAVPPAPGSLDSFLVERYSLFVVDSSNGRIHRGDVHHAPWSLQGAEIEIAENTVPLASGLAVPMPQVPDHVGFSPGVSTEAVPFVEVT